MRPRRARLLSVALLAALLAVGMAFGDRQMDLSAGHTYTLSSGTRDFLTALDLPITIEVFYDRAQPGERSRTLPGGSPGRRVASG